MRFKEVKSFAQCHPDFNCRGLGLKPCAGLTLLQFYNMDLLLSNLQLCVTDTYVVHNTWPESPVSSERDRKCANGHSEELDITFISEKSRKDLFM